MCTEPKVMCTRSNDDLVAALHRACGIGAKGSITRTSRCSCCGAEGLIAVLAVRVGEIRDSITVEAEKVAEFSPTVRLSLVKLARAEPGSRSSTCIIAGAPSSVPISGAEGLTFRGTLVRGMDPRGVTGVREKNREKNSGSRAL
jgi:hypothetical protein